MTANPSNSANSISRYASKRFASGKGYSGLIERYGVPTALYTDWKNVYVLELTEAQRLRGEQPTSQLGRICAHLGIGIIAVNLTQAKGRVERAHGSH